MLGPPPFLCQFLPDAAGQKPAVLLPQGEHLWVVTLEAKCGGQRRKLKGKNPQLCYPEVAGPARASSGPVRNLMGRS